MMRTLQTKAMRDLWHFRGQSFAIALVMASGTAVLVMALSTLGALRDSSAAYYRQQHFADVFVYLKRAPERVAERVRQLPGVLGVETRVVHAATLDIDGFSEPAIGQFVSLPARARPQLNQPVLRQGRWPAAVDEIVLNEPFAEAHGFLPGDRIVAILNGHRRELGVSGIALSPEYIYSLGPGALLPDDERFGIIWASRAMLEAAVDMKGAFNELSLTLQAGARPELILERLDDLLEPYGGTGAIARADQISNWFVMNELDQLTTMARLLPTIFLGIAAFLTHTLLSRMLTIERSQIGLLKAFGYSKLEIGWHYTTIVLGIVVIGLLIGFLLGAWLGWLQTNMYTDVFRFPVLIYYPRVEALALASAATCIAALSGAWSSVRAAVNLPPAQAMQPPAPPSFHKSVLARFAWGRWLDQPSRIVLRNIARWPVRAALTLCGMAASVSLLVLTLQWSDSLEYLSRSHFYDAQRQHLMLGMAEPRNREVLETVANLPGVMSVEPMRIVSAELASGHIKHRGSLMGLVSQPQLQPIYDDATKRDLVTPSDGVVLGSFLAAKLGVSSGDRIWVEILEGRQPRVELTVVDTVETYLGMPAYVHIDRLNGLLKDPGLVEYVSVLVDEAEQQALYEKIKEIPTIAAVMLRDAAVASFDDTMKENLMVFVTIFGGLACVMGFGVAYNSARITLSERGRELATLRVLGFTRGEIGYILLGEVALLTVVSLPLGCVLGLGLSNLMASAFNTELFRIPLKIAPSSYALAVTYVLLVTALSAAVVRRRIHRLNLIEVLKTRE